MSILFLFLDGVGLGEDNPDINPLARPVLTNLTDILGGHRLISDGYSAHKEENGLLANTALASLLALDACLDVEGIPQSATGQASLMTGKNISALIGIHEGPKPTPEIIELIQMGTVFTKLQKLGKTGSLLNAFPPRYFKAIEDGYRIPGVIALSTRKAGIALKTVDDLNEGNAISADFTAEGWRNQLGLKHTPVLDHVQAGERLNQLTGLSDLAIFEYWLTDMAGHHQDMQWACSLLRTFDTVMGSLLENWNAGDSLILLTSDHGNLEDLRSRHHTRNEVPLLLIGIPESRERFIQQINLSRGERSKPNLADIAPAIAHFLG